MNSFKLKARIGADATLQWLDPPPNLPEGDVEIIVLYKPMPNRTSANTAYEPTSPTSIPTPIVYSDKQALRESVEHLYATLGITRSPIGIESLQQLMGAQGLEDNELSRDLIAMRDE